VILRRRPPTSDTGRHVSHRERSHVARLALAADDLVGDDGPCRAPLRPGGPLRRAAHAPSHSAEHRATVIASTFKVSAQNGIRTAATGGLTVVGTKSGVGRRATSERATPGSSMSVAPRVHTAPLRLPNAETGDTPNRGGSTPRELRRVVH
jgi:hypothetical protein